ncbi:MULTISPECIES: hypothetical protein [unclassified Mesorhizobium]|uniref:hypothetical protein n=1 Tax=unclassified Mesorhizobium TaxID=325217 RepID=UPI0009592A83|nr:MULTISPECIES: hypothetical protein [unclassified Mesorhizobium]MBN9254272.1 hypothetical protein [Mesorhizobium sp.]MBN9272822.1 hypothetical protein [Mesorhizobium sp.]OJX76387.1 MAG: hypothetical protein BGO93_30985 [Mesorhizobium sp. 65-26]
MKSLLCAMALLAVMVAPVAAEVRYDRNLERAVMDIVAARMGGIRGGFTYKQVPQLVPEAAPADIAPERAREDAKRDLDDGLAPAVERRISPAIF